MTALPAAARTMAPGGFSTAVLIPEGTIIPAGTTVVVTAAAVTAVEVVMAEEEAEIESRGTLLLIPFTGLR